MRQKFFWPRRSGASAQGSAELHSAVSPTCSRQDGDRSGRLQAGRRPAGSKLAYYVETFAKTSTIAVARTSQNFLERESLGEPDIRLKLRERAWKFDPPEIRVRQGQIVEITFEPTDNGLGVGHGFAISSYDEVAFINGAMVGAPKTVTFRADGAGKFTFYCPTQCSTDKLHPLMNGTLVVEPVPAQTAQGVFQKSVLGSTGYQPTGIELRPERVGRSVLAEPSQEQSLNGFAARQDGLALPPESLDSSTAVGYQPVPSGNLPDGTGAASRNHPGAGIVATPAAIPVGRLPTGAGKLPALPIFQTRSQLE